MKIKATGIVNKFKCLQGDCPDTCCKGWSMQLDDFTFEKYKNTPLESAVSYDGAEDEIRVMKRDPETDYCVKFENGICAIHRDKGPELLGDACNFYPRVTRRFGDEVVMTATLSCPEIVNLSLYGENLEFEITETARLPHSLKNYEGSLAVHEAFLNLCAADMPAEKIAAIIYSASRSLSANNQNDWPNAAPFFLKIAGNMLPPADYPEDFENYLLQIFAAVFHATGKRMNPRLAEIIGRIEAYLAVKIDWATLELEVTGEAQYNESIHNDELRKYLAAQISFNSFPYAGIGEDINERAMVMMYKFALIKLALRAMNSQDKDVVIHTIQSISRIIDHIGDAALILSLMRSFGWDSDGKMVGIIS